MWRLLAVLALISVGCASSDIGSRSGGAASNAYVADTVLRAIGTARAVDFDRFNDIFVLRENSVTKFSAAGDSLRSVTGHGSEHYQFNDAVDIDARFPNTVLVADRLNHRVEIYSRDLNYLTTLYTRDDPNPDRRFGYPLAAAADPGGNIFVLDGENQRVVKFRSDRSFERSFGGYSQSSRPEGVLADPRTLVVDNDGNVAVLDLRGTSIVTFDDFGTVISRRALPGAASRLAVSSDTLFALVQPSDSNVVFLLYRMPALEPIGDVLRTNEPRFIDAAIRSSIGIAIDGRNLERFSLLPALPPTH